MLTAPPGASLRTGLRLRHAVPRRHPLCRGGGYRMRRKVSSSVRQPASLLLRAVVAALLACSALLVEYARGAAIRSVCGVVDVMLSGLPVVLADAATKRTHCLHGFN